MTATQFRQLALAVPGAVESAHMDHPDFRVNGRIFASLGYPEDGWAMVKLTPEEQQDWMRRHPEVFEPCAGAWGRGGATCIRLKPARAVMVRPALAAAGAAVRAARARR